MDQATSTMANPSIQREQVYGEVQVLFLSSCPQNSLENIKYLLRRIKISRYLVTFHVPCWPWAAGHEWQTMIPGCEVKYELSFYLGSIVKDGNGVTVVTTILIILWNQISSGAIFSMYTLQSGYIYTWSCQRARKWCNYQQVPPPYQYSGEISDRKNVV